MGNLTKLSIMPVALQIYAKEPSASTKLDNDFNFSFQFPSQYLEKKGMGLPLGKNISQGCMHEKSTDSNELASVMWYPLLSSQAHISLNLFSVSLHIFANNL